jgi:hypothetical protein
MNIQALMNLPGEIGRIKWLRSNFPGMTQGQIRRHLEDIADALEPMRFMHQDQIRLEKFHDTLITVITAVQDVNKNYRGRPTEIKREYLEGRYPKQIANLAMILIGQEICEFYEQLWKSTDVTKVAQVEFNNAPTVLHNPTTTVESVTAFQGVFLEPQAGLEHRV